MKQDCHASIFTHAAWVPEGPVGHLWYVRLRSVLRAEYTTLFPPLFYQFPPPLFLFLLRSCSFVCLLDLHGLIPYDGTYKVRVPLRTRTGQVTRTDTHTKLFDVSKSKLTT